MKQLITFLTFNLCIISPIFGQQETQEWNGKQYFVYPYQQEVEYNLRFFKMGVKQEEIIQRDSLNRAIVSSGVKPVRRYTKMSHNKAFKKEKKTLLALRKDHPGVFLNFYIPLDRDVVPVLESLPDGDYVQFYRDIPFVDNKHVLRYRNDQVAAVFTLKNNQLNGYAYWLTTLGDTIKAGYFQDGLKTGDWYFRQYYFSNDEGKKSTVENYLNGTYKDTSFILVHYTNGLLDGPYAEGRNNTILEKGFYKNGKASGEWFEYGYKILREDYIPVYTGELIVMRHYFIPEKEVKGKSVIVRNQIVDLSNTDRNEFDFNYYNLENFEAFANYYHLYEEKEEEGLELPEEKMRSYPGEDYNEGLVYSENGMSSLGNIDFSYSSNERKYFINEKYYSRSQLIDSIGYVFKFDRIYEEYHENGQLRLRFEIKNGELVKEDTIFWDNGTPANVVNFLAETNEYEEKTFDYQQQLIHHKIYDSIGNYVKTINQKIPANKHRIHDRIYSAYVYEMLFSYEKYDTLNVVLTQPQLIAESLWKYDTTQVATTVFDPESRTLSSRYYALNKDLINQIDATFSEDYESVNATENYTVGKLSARTITSGTYNHYSSIFNRNINEDTVLNKRAKFWSRNYQTTSDHTLFYDNQPFSGKFMITTNSKHFNVSASPDLIDFHYADGKQHQKEVDRAYHAYIKKRKEKKLTQYMGMGTLYSKNISRNFNYNIIPFSTYLFEPVDEEHFYESGSELDYNHRKLIKVGEKKAPSFDKTVKGQFLNGKPEGEWITSNQFGDVTAKVTFKNGEIDGPVYYYEIKYPIKKELLFYYELSVNPLLRDSMPSKPTYFLAKTAHYKNGILNGDYVEYNWLGDTITHWNYVDGHMEGPSLERSKLAFTQAHYENGALDGIVQTYLTIPGRDTTLLFDLNFQNGSLQGESKAYHLNGNIAKHGFFLSGEPIDDFEAFDSLGFKYQYVKFLYNQPVEEKIWEENQLSVRYEFDWKDSIYFNTRDIAGSTSLERMLSKLGISGNEYNEPYMGRPSLVDKTGINYTMTKYYPNDTIARKGEIASGKKIGHWSFYSYEGKPLYEVNYFDSILHINDSIRFKSKGILTLLDSNRQAICKSYIVEKIEKYDCSHTDHHEIRMLYTFWERNTNEHRINGYVKNYYDNGVLMNEGMVKNGLATGVWKFYDPYGSLNMVGEYVLGKRNGRWLSGDLAQVKYMGDICLNPNLPNLDEIMSYQEKLLDISVIHYQMTVVKKREYYGVNMNADGPPDGYFNEDGYYDEEMYYDEEIRSDIQLR